jgi:Xaa-Pro aminopeptidase
MQEPFANRLALVRQVMAERQIDAVLVLVEQNRLYLSGFTGEDHQFDESSGALLITGEHQVLATDSRFELQAQQEAPLYEVVIYRNGLAKQMALMADRFKFRRLGFESARVSVQQHTMLQKEINVEARQVELVPLEDLVETFRQVKTDEEIHKTQKALDLAEEVFRRVVKTLKPGMNEKQVAWAMEKGMREAGADSLSFPVIVAFGPNSALPHAIPGERELRTGEPILFDWGARLNGYCSDTSRTVILGEPDEMFLKVYHTVLEAQQRAIAAIRTGANSKAVDSEARSYIDRQGFEGRFGHGLGHGTGLAVHEAPRLSPLRETRLKAGMIVTVEPGVYIPDWGGVRIENQVVVGDQGPRVLNHLGTACSIDAF